MSKGDKDELRQRVWNSLPTADRYSIAGKRFMYDWTERRLVSLDSLSGKLMAEYLRERCSQQKE